MKRYRNHLTPLPYLLHYPIYSITLSTPLPYLLHYPIYSITLSTPLLYLLHYSIYSITLSTPLLYLLHYSIYSITLSTPLLYLLHYSIYSITLSTPLLYLLHYSIYSITLSTPLLYLLHYSIYSITLSAPLLYLLHYSIYSITLSTPLLYLLHYSICSIRLVIQRTKRVDVSQKALLQMLETLTSGTEKEKQELMSICVDILSNYSMTDLVTPIFVFEQLCNIIHPVSYIVTSLLIAVSHRRKRMLASFISSWTRIRNKKSSYRGVCRVTRTVAETLGWDL